MILNEETNEDNFNLQKLRNEIKFKTENFLNGFMKIGTIENQKFPSGATRDRRSFTKFVCNSNSLGTKRFH